MVPRLSVLRSIFKTAHGSSRAGARRPFAALPLERPIEEETLPHYDPEQFYPVNIGDIYNERYQITGKLGFGAYSTSWLCRDLRTQSFAALKVSTSLRKFPTATDREYKIYEHLAGLETPHPGQALVRELWDTFDLFSSAGKHQCLVLQPMHMTVLEMMTLNPRPFDLPLLKMTLRRLLLALDFLHTEADTIHTGTAISRTGHPGDMLTRPDLKTDNLMLSLEDDSMLSHFASEEIAQPSPRKRIDEARNIYQSRQFRRPSPRKGFGLPVLCDFGEARIGKVQESGPFVQPHIYRAPEIIFEMPWGSAVDIWNLGALIWDLFEGQHLFGDIFDDQGNHDPFKHLASMVALIGPPPKEFVRRSETTTQCFDDQGAWIAEGDASVPLVSLEDLEKRLAGDEKGRFLAFLRSMLRWLPEERRTAKQLLDDPWLL